MADLEETYAGAEDVPEEVEQRLGEIETALEALDHRSITFNPDEVERAGAFVSIDPAVVETVEELAAEPEVATDDETSVGEDAVIDEDEEVAFDPLALAAE